VGGYRLGFIARSASWLGLAAGLFLASRVLPDVLDAVEDRDQLTVLLAAVVVLIGGAFIGQAIGLLIGSKLHLVLPMGPARQLDRAAGAAAAIVGVVVAVWFLLPALASAEGWPARASRNSVIAKAIDDALPQPPDTLQALRRLVGDRQFVQVFADLRPAPELGPPPAETGLSQELAQEVRRSTFKIQGVACNRIQEGSGFAAGDGIVVTNAHVVAGVDEPSVIRADDGTEVPGRVVAFDPNRDLAVIAAPGLERPALPIGDAVEGDVGAVFGHPGGGALELSPYQVAREVTAEGFDLYHRNRIERRVFFLSSQLAPGDSGGALISPAGDVVGVAFAIAPDRPEVAYALTTDELNAVLGGDLSTQVDTGDCLR
jgi:S1-C subfamily serine protease